MKRIILIISILCLNASAQTPDVNTQLIALRDQLTAVHVAQLATVSADFKSQLDAANAERDAALAQLASLQSQITTVLNAQLISLQQQLAAAQNANDATATSAAQAQIDTINALVAQAAKSDKQKALDAAIAAKAAADKALADAQAALNTP